MLKKKKTFASKLLINFQNCVWVSVWKNKKNIHNDFLQLNRENRRKNRDKNKFYGKIHYYLFGNFPGGSVVKSLPAKQEKLVRSLGWKYPWRRKQQPTPEEPVHGVTQSVRQNLVIKQQ